MKFIFQNLYNMIFSGAAKVITDASSCSVDIFNQDVVKQLLDFFEFLGMVLVGIGILFAIANFCVSKIEGDCIPFDQLFMNILYTIIAAAFVQDGCIFIFNIADYINSQISTVVKMQKPDEIMKVLSTALEPYSLIWEISMLIVFIISLLMVYFQAAKRSGMYLVQLIVGYLYLFGLPSGNTEGLFDWCRQTAALAITNILQMSLLIVAMRFLSVQKVLLCLVTLLAATSVEKVAARFGMSAGSRQMVGAGVRTVGSTVNLVTNIKRAAA